MEMKTKTKRIGIIGAMKCETDALKALMTCTMTETISGIEYVSGSLSGVHAVVATCGVGKVAAAVCAQTMILRYAPSAIINTGVAGSLSENLGVLDVAVSENTVEHDMDTTALGDPAGLISGLNIIKIPADLKLSKIASETAEGLGIKSILGTVASGDSFVCDANVKKRIHDNFGAIACEMEGASIGHVCYMNETPFVVIRAISDGGDDEAAMTYDKFAPIAAENSVKIILGMLDKI